MDIFNGLEVDSWPVETDHRPLRSVGAAISYAVGLLECSFRYLPARILTFVGGPCTHGPGKIVDVDRTKVIRTWTELVKEDTNQSQKASEV